MKKPHKRYDLNRLASLYRDDQPSLSEAESIEKAVVLRRRLHADNRQEYRNDARYQALPQRMLSSGTYYASGVGFRSGPCSSDPFQSDPAEGWVQKMDLESGLRSLPNRQQKIVSLRAQGFTLEEISAKVQLSNSRVQELEKAAYQTLAAALGLEV